MLIQLCMTASGVKQKQHENVQRFSLLYQTKLFRHISRIVPDESCSLNKAFQLINIRRIQGGGAGLVVPAHGTTVPGKNQVFRLFGPQLPIFIRYTYMGSAIGKIGNIPTLEGNLDASETFSCLQTYAGKDFWVVSIILRTFDLAAASL